MNFMRNAISFPFLLNFASVNQVGERYINNVFVVCIFLYGPVISPPVLGFGVLFLCKRVAGL